MNTVTEILLAMSDTAYRDFTAKLTPNIEKEKILGVRTPDIRLLAKRLYGTDEGEKFLNELPHTFFEENKLHAAVISMIKDYDRLVSEIDRFLPFVDNWAVCDSILPSLFKKHPERLPFDAKRWCGSENTYTARFGMNVFMAHYLDREFKKEYIDIVTAVKGDGYYVRMGKAWYLATALAKQYDCALPVLTENRLDTWTHNKTISKACDSFRITPDVKVYLKTLRRKEKTDEKTDR